MTKTLTHKKRCYNCGEEMDPHGTDYRSTDNEPLCQGCYRDDYGNRLAKAAPALLAALNPASTSVTHRTGNGVKPSAVK